MADMKSEDMKDEKIGWKAQALSLYQSLVVIIFGTLSFILRLLQEYFKMGGSTKEEKPKSAESISGKGISQSAGENQVEEGSKLAEQVPPASEHTVVELPPVVEQVPPPSAIITKKVEETKESSTEPTDDQSKNTLVIKNLPFKFKPADLEKLLAEHQARPKNVRLLRDENGRFSGMAFIRCPSKEEAQHLISSMNGLDIAGRNVQVEFKLKKKKSKGKLDASFDSLSSSSDELPGNRLRISNDANIEPSANVSDTVQQIPITVQSAVTHNSRTATRNKLSVSDEHVMTEPKVPQPQKKPAFQPRRKSTSNAYEPNQLYVNSALPRLHLEADPRGLTTIRPVRQPYAPDGTNGFSLEYRRSRGINC